MTKNTIMHGDCLDLLIGLPENSVDCCVTDPPYGWKFMGKKWDYEIPGIPIWEEVYRVLKPGAHMLVACGTRTRHRMVVNIEDAGFEIRDVICWHYGSGFPKSLNISKAIDNGLGVERAVLGRKKGAATANTESLGIFKPEYNETLPATEAAKQWDGWGTVLKPATEFWTLARKPISESTVAANILRWGVGGLNIDVCRIGSYEEITTHARGTRSKHFHQVGEHGNYQSEGQKLGRFPANLILDDFMAEEMDQQSGERKAGGSRTGKEPSDKTKNCYGDYGRVSWESYEDSGGASRFFYVAKPSPEERGDSTHPTVKPQALIQYLIKLICPLEPGRVILEPFAGSGAHCIAARKLGLDFYACEIGEKECKEANERLTKQMGLFA